MGYESRVYIINKHDVNFPCKNPYGEVLAVLNMSKMCGNGWISLFDKEIDFVSYKENGNTRIKKDSYSDVCKYAELDSVIDWLKRNMEERNFKRDRVLYNLLKSFKSKEWKNNHIVVLHYGY